MTNAQLLGLYAAFNPSALLLSFAVDLLHAELATSF